MTTPNPESPNQLGAFPWLVTDESNELGQLSRKTQRRIILLFGFSIAAIVVNIVFGALDGSYGFFWFPVVYWALMACGYFGIKLRHYLLVTVFCFASVVMVCLTFLQIIFIFVWVADLVALINLCNDYDYDYDYEYDYCDTGKYKAAIAFAFIDFIVLIIEVIIWIVTLTSAFKVRRLLLGMIPTVVVVQQQQTYVTQQQVPPQQYS